MHHPELFKEKVIFDKPFSERLIDELDFAEREYIKKNKDFVINISSPSTTLFQILSSNMLESSDGNKKGFGLHLSFDESHEESLEEIKKFRDQEYSKEFEYHDLDEIPTYQIDLKTNKEQIKELVTKILEDVYEQDVEIIETDNFEN